MKTFVGKGVGKHIIYHLFNAKKQALICSPWLDEHYAEAIVRMAQRGVNVKLITSNRKTGDFSAYAYIMKHLRPNGGNSPLELTMVDSSFIHAKLYVVDEEYAAIGSANLTTAGMYENVESIATCDGVDVHSIKNDFEKIWRYNGKGIANGKERGYQSISISTRTS